MQKHLEFVLREVYGMISLVKFKYISCNLLTSIREWSFTKNKFKKYAEEKMEGDRRTLV